MKNYYEKIVFVVVVVAVGLISRAIYPRLYPVAAGNSSAATESSTNGIPRFVLPALSLVSVQGAATSSVSPGGDLESGTGAISQESIPPDDAGDVLVAPTGPVLGSVFSHSSGTPPPALDLTAALIADLGTGARFMSLNATKRWPLASVTKLMTATVAIDELSPAQKITITQDDLAVDPSEKTLHIGDTYTVNDLFHSCFCRHPMSPRKLWLARTAGRRSLRR